MQYSQTSETNSFINVGHTVKVFISNLCQSSHYYYIQHTLSKLYTLAFSRLGVLHTFSNGFLQQCSSALL